MMLRRQSASAIALVAAERRPPTLTLVTCDYRLREAAGKEGFLLADLSRRAAYSLDRARAGSIRVTRRAGRRLAARLTHASITATAVNTAASRGFT